jgi:hypothetical protein
MDITYECKVCKVSIHPKRVSLGYKDTCPQHSTVSKYTGHLLVEGNTIEDVMSTMEVIKDSKIAKEIERNYKSLG